jgi:predicted helicase
LSQLLIHQYLNQLSSLRKVSGTSRESVVREAFKDLLKGWGRSHDLVFIPEHEVASPTKERRYVDGALMHTLRVPFGYWEAKDEKDDLDAEIEFKFKRGYPKTNIIFEDSETAVLIQHGVEVMRCGVEDVENLEKLLKLFFGYERPEIEAFRKAVAQFKTDLPAVLEALREMIEAAHTAEPKFRKAALAFLKHAQDAINPSLTAADVREMLIQHVLTGEVFAAVFPGTSYHEDNNVARELHKLEDTFFTGNTRFQTLKGLAPYYTAIRKAASEISAHHEKQTFLKAIYENFYKVYNPKAADRLGVVYTPNEIVRFMIESADWLCETHFKRNLIDKEVEILDPATGTGTFICELLEHFRGQPAKLKHKYLHELHANEVAILPYYVANLNIEATYAAIAGDYQEFPSLCLVDTLDNTHGLRKHAGHMDDIFGSVTDENVGRIRRQNSRRISVIIGNPPYNANQLNENENNKNREYPDIDKRIKDTYIEESTAQKTKLYDMYARFFRWASDRLDANGILAFVTNRSFIDSRTFDGFRKIVEREFNDIYIVDLGGDVRANPKLSGTKHNVFGIQTGVAISFMVKRAHAGKPVKGCRIHYVRRPEMETAEEKLEFLSSMKCPSLKFKELSSDENHNWLNPTNTDFGSFLALVPRQGAKSIFMLGANAIKTNRDDWVFDFSLPSLRDRVSFFVDRFNAQLAKGLGDPGKLDYSIKWSSGLKAITRKVEATDDNFVEAVWRPFVRKSYFAHKSLSDRLTGHHFSMFGPTLSLRNRSICFVFGSRLEFGALAVDAPTSYSLFVLDPVFCVSEKKFTGVGNSEDNITDWALDQFKKNYQPGRGKKDRPITKEAIFHYVYAVLHDPVYREKYAINLKREFPRIPFYADFWQWADWGKNLMGLHIGYETVAPWKLSRSDMTPPKPLSGTPKAMLRTDKEAGTIALDELTILGDIPPEAWDYKLGNRSALEWILDQYKEKKPKDPTIREKFDTYRFADYKDKVIDLLVRVTRVSVETQKIVTAMRSASR